MNMDTHWFMNWYWQEATEDEQTLFEKMIRFEQEYFGDMLFHYGSNTYELIHILSKDVNAQEWVDDSAPIPEVLEFFSPEMIRLKIENTDEMNGYYNHSEQVLCISSNSINDDSALLHEMIHMHEGIINELPMHYHDMVFWSLYKSLRTSLPELDDIITNHAHILNETELYESGGLHDILFLLKSFDIDIGMGYPLGTVFGYGKMDDFKEYTVNY
ncbi:MAG: hypothetical protein IJ121_02930 [Eubacterium sp.]|nr:hypothetical protein [Eubacterium sp.]